MMMRISVLRNCFVSFLAAVACFACVAAAGAPVKWPKLPTPPAPPKAPEPPKPYFPPSRPLTPIEMEQAERAKKAALEGLKTNLVVPEKAPEQDSLEKLIEKLLNEFGPDGRYGITSHFIVIYDTTDSYAMWCATLMENVTSTYEKFVSSTKLVEDGLADPMVVFIFAFPLCRYCRMTSTHSGASTFTSIVPSCTPAISAIWSATERIGGFIFQHPSSCSMPSFSSR